MSISCSARSALFIGAAAGLASFLAMVEWPRMPTPPEAAVLALYCDEPATVPPEDKLGCATFHSMGLIPGGWLDKLEQ